METVVNRPSLSSGSCVYVSSWAGLRKCHQAHQRQSGAEQRQRRVPQSYPRCLCCCRRIRCQPRRPRQWAKGHSLEVENFRIHHDLPGVDRQIGIIERPIECFRCDRLVRWIVVRRKVLVRQRCRCIDTSPRVENEHLLQQIEGCCKYSQREHFVTLRGSAWDSPRGSAPRNFCANGIRSRFGRD